MKVKVSLCQHRAVNADYAKNAVYAADCGRAEARCEAAGSAFIRETFLSDQLTPELQLPFETLYNTHLHGPTT